MFDFGLVRVEPLGLGGFSVWCWALTFRDGRIFHIVRRSGKLREWR